MNSTNVQSDEPSTAELQQRVEAIDRLVSHVWMVRAFLKHCDEAVDDEELQEIHRDLYDFMLSLGSSLADGEYAAYLKQARKKLSKLRKATDLFVAIQPEVSTHTNFQMAARSLKTAVDQMQPLIKPNEQAIRSSP
ncbi:MAG: amidohydrolase [Pirellulaceae bacterium]